MSPTALPRVSRSVVAPIVVGLRPSDPHAVVLRDALAAAAHSLPPHVTAGSSRMCRMVVGARDDDLDGFARLIDGPSDDGGNDFDIDHHDDDAHDGLEPEWTPDPDSIRWTVGVRSMDVGLGGPFVGCRTVYRIEVLVFRMLLGAVVDAPQLALFRHLLVSGLRAADPRAVVVGGQHDWHDEWWC